MFKTKRRMGRARQGLAALAIVSFGLAAAVVPSTASAAQFFQGSVAGGGHRCAYPDPFCNQKSRNGSATWLAGYLGYIGVYRTSAGWIALDQNGSGAGSVSTYTSVFVTCGNSSAVTYTLICNTSNL